VPGGKDGPERLKKFQEGREPHPLHLLCVPCYFPAPIFFSKKKQDRFKEHVFYYKAIWKAYLLKISFNSQDPYFICLVTFLHQFFSSKKDRFKKHVFYYKAIWKAYSLKNFFFIHKPLPSDWRFLGFSTKIIYF